MRFTACPVEPRLRMIGLPSKTFPLLGSRFQLPSTMLACLLNHCQII